VERKIRRQTKVKAKEHTLDTDEFNQLTDILFELFKENHSACARVLGVSRLTWRKWEKEPPTWPWWNLVLRHIIKSYLAPLAARRGLTKKHRQVLLDRFNSLTDGSEMLDEIDRLAYDIAGAATHLRRLLSRKGMFWDEIRLPAHCGGYNMKTLRRAAKQIGVIKSSEGYGENKRSYWRLPDQDDE
jgi:hypothetical protein